ncbi:hypothetical protein [Ilumatobacter sp.]|uniref:hypothetical protein n=1 Tax=Ilumatobacter sp. TaxID=1967498 RepID=UPI003B5226BC
MSVTVAPPGGALLEAADEAAALERLHELGCTDGLPVVVPTPARVERMVTATGYEADMALGSMGPNQGSCTIEKLATAAVMAGCVPDVAPVVVAAAIAVMDERFDLTEMQATTYSTAPLIIVNGPAAGWCDVSGGYGALGPGHRANATIGRALRLAMINVGGGRAGTSDMSLLGHPGKFTMCLAEDAEHSPFEPLHVALGHAEGTSTVTVIGADAPQSVMGVVDGDDPSGPDRLLRSFARAFANVTTNNVAIGGGQAALAINPDHAAVLAAAGHDRASIQQRVTEQAIVEGDDLAASAGYMGSRPSPEHRRRCFQRPEDLLVFVAGGGGLYSAAFPSWCAGPHRNRAVTVEIEIGDACEIPAFADA